MLYLAFTQPNLPLEIVAPTPLEAWAVITGALCVWLTVIRHILNFPVSIASCLLFAILFNEIRLYGDMYLQFFFIALAVHGWYWWLRGGQYRSKLEVTKATSKDWWLLTLGFVVGVPLLIWILTRHGSAPFWDSFTTVGSVLAQVMLNRKKYETWFLWILVDIVYVPLYWSKDLRLTAILYAVFLVMCIAGLIDWSKALRSKETMEQAFA